jgi:mRNA-degrading endonuclease RelE of RelBE toxin-antitoxin system
MTEVGAGGVVITGWQPSNRYSRDFKKLTAHMRQLVTEKLSALQANPRPPSLGFEKLKGYGNPDIYTIHITGNYKLSFQLSGSLAQLRRVAPHDEIDRAP